MTGQEAGEVVDKLAEKLGVAVEKITPLAEETISQYVRAQLIWAVCGICLFVAGVWFVLFIKQQMVKWFKEWEEMGATMATVFGFIGGGTCVIAGFFVFFDAITNAVAPYPSLLGL